LHNGCIGRAASIHTGFPACEQPASNVVSRRPKSVKEAVHLAAPGDMYEADRQTRPTERADLLPGQPALIHPHPQPPFLPPPKSPRSLRTPCAGPPFLALSEPLFACRERREREGSAMFSRGEVSYEPHLPEPPPIGFNVSEQATAQHKRTPHPRIQPPLSPSNLTPQTSTTSTSTSTTFVPPSPTPTNT
jgi:hypothetical protein